MRRLLRFGCFSVIAIVAVVLVAGSRLGTTSNKTGQPQTAIENTVPTRSTSRPDPPTASLLQAAPLTYKVATDEIIEAPNGRTRVRREIVIPESGSPEQVAATLADAVRQGFANHSNAVVSVVFGYGPNDDLGSGFTQGRASASRDGKGLDAGSAQLLAGPDTGDIQIEVATDWYQGMPTETKMVHLPLVAQ